MSNIEVFSKWISEKAVHAIVVFFIIIGSTAVTIYSKERIKLSLGKKIVSRLIAAIVFALPMGYLIENSDWNVYFLCFVAFFVGAISDWGMRNIFLLWENSDGWIDFFGRITRAIQAGWKAYDSVKNPRQ